MGYQYLIDNQEQLLKRLISIIYKYYCDIWNEYDLGEYFDFVKSEREIINTIEPHRIYILNFEKDGIPYIGYEFQCDWELEHGVGIMLYKDTLIDVGPAEIAFSSDVVDDDLNKRNA